jgi:hypothetical protein
MPSTADGRNLIWHQLWQYQAICDVDTELIAAPPPRRVTAKPGKEAAWLCI